MGEGLSRQRGEREQRLGGWQQPGVLRKLQSWVGLTFMGSVMDIPLGAGKGLIQANKGAREWEAGGSWLLYSGRAGQAVCRAGWNSGLGARIQLGIQGDRSGRVLSLLAHHCLAVSREKSQPGNLGFTEGSAYVEGAAPFLQPFFLPASHHPARGSWRGLAASLAGETDAGAQPRGPPASHGLQPRRKENSERLRDPEIINVRVGRSLPIPPSPFVPDSRWEPRSQSGREGDCSRSQQGWG